MGPSCTTLGCIMRDPKSVHQTSMFIATPLTIKLWMQPTHPLVDEGGNLGFYAAWKNETTSFSEKKTMDRTGGHCVW